MKMYLKYEYNTMVCVREEIPPWSVFVQSIWCWILEYVFALCELKLLLRSSRLLLHSVRIVFSPEFAASNLMSGN